MNGIFERSYAAMMMKVFRSSPTYVAQTRLKAIALPGQVKKSKRFG